MAEKFESYDLQQYDDMFFSELRDKTEELLNKHESTPRIFYPYDHADELSALIENEGFIPEDAPISPEIAAALSVNLNTEEGLPYYTATLLKGLPDEHPFRYWMYGWTAEEGRHAPTIANWIHAAKIMDMHELEDARMAMMKNPDTPQPKSFVEGIIYPAIQEPATEISHRNTARRLPTEHRIGKQALLSVTGDEVKHGIFYRGLAAEAFIVAPSIATIGLARQIKGFAMPGKSIPGFSEKSKNIEHLGIFGAKQLKDIYIELLEDWGVMELENLTPEAEAARDFITKRMRQMDLVIARNERVRSIE